MHKLTLLVGLTSLIVLPGCGSCKKENATKKKDVNTHIDRSIEVIEIETEEIAENNNKF